MKHTVKTKSGNTVEIEPYYRSTAIKLMCTECMGYGEAHPDKCDSITCPLYPYRGKTTKAYD